ncbi:hypothetical protein H4F51_11195 [Pectobacterium brasiliense]|uniref:hypothetical protein n=1 Tax=Pectobacterium brasiliense TaxID=180957 RepID=UPI0015DF635A|nr:hypothetical protein [Pectobacterium brasiliense]MBA0198428.1 hypothetical protein [Pectobacterium brasiliense]MBN3095958.1 hypothetical protein [Pectobacterium brasiliense]MBN3140498.1 hypothetical protein [Pectobacterium brasiliense]MBW5898028.1 hypothetical protein [Pectobacterium brasiliense]
MAVRKHQENGCVSAIREGKRVRKQFATKVEAVTFERFTTDQSKDVAPFCYAWH